jgi:hypothetical protein
MFMKKRKPLSSKIFSVTLRINKQSIVTSPEQIALFLGREFFPRWVCLSFFLKKKKRTTYYLGDRHRAHRKLFNPAFSIAHMREIGMCQRICIKKHPFDRAVTI